MQATSSAFLGSLLWHRISSHDSSFRCTAHYGRSMKRRGCLVFGVLYWSFSVDRPAHGARTLPLFLRGRVGAVGPHQTTTEPHDRYSLVSSQRQPLCLIRSRGSVRLYRFKNGLRKG